MVDIALYDLWPNHILLNTTCNKSAPIARMAVNIRSPPWYVDHHETHHFDHSSVMEACIEYIGGPRTTWVPHLPFPTRNPVRLARARLKRLIFRWVDTARTRDSFLLIAKALGTTSSRLRLEIPISGRLIWLRSEFQIPGLPY